MEISICPGCGLELESTDLGMDSRFNASCACRGLYDELSAFTLTAGSTDFIHQLIVDTYRAQHVGPNVKPISVAFSLIGLYLVFERGYNGRQVQLAHMALAAKSKQLPHFNPPPMTGTTTVFDIFNGINDENSRKRIYDWAIAVWKAWKSYHAEVADLANKYLNFV